MDTKKLTRSEMKQIFCGQDLRKFRDEKCLSQEYIANLLEINQSTYQRIETGKIKLSMELIAKLTAIFNNPLSSFEEADTSNEVELMKKTIIQLEKRIEELEEKVSRKNLKIEELKKRINTIY
ncbi:helix-turn-helix transcriptional regulator [Pedobacter borealis]|uniref:helix-turn-helix transcriptional regulator n=1 Tax=Pedobacter borealis TaxID=475254 RepID=UPI000493798D|nr:helix-turn-helix transcriptional regulator [Pedobacter borealis]